LRLVRTLVILFLFFFPRVLSGGADAYMVDVHCFLSYIIPGKGKSNNTNSEQSTSLRGMAEGSILVKKI
jgi:hypothetical protein